MTGSNMRQSIALLLVSSALAGCYESLDITWYEPHEYKGGEDPLLEQQRSEKQRDDLRERFALVQIDR